MTGSFTMKFMMLLTDDFTVLIDQPCLARSRNNKNVKFLWTICHYNDHEKLYPPKKTTQGNTNFPNCADDGANQ